MTSKWIPNEPYGRQKTLPTPSRKRTENKHEKRTSKTRKNKPVLAREREARLNIRALSETRSQRLRQHALDRKSAPSDYAPTWHQHYSDQVNGPMSL